MEYKFHKEYFIDNDDDTVELFGKDVSIGFSSGRLLTRKVLCILHKAGKPYVSLEGEEVKEVAKPTPKVKVKTKKKKAKIDEPKEEKQPVIKPESNEEES